MGIDVFLDAFLNQCLSNHLPLNPVHLEPHYKGMHSPVLLSNPCASFSLKVCQDFRETEHSLTAGASPKTCFSCPVEAPLYRRSPTPSTKLFSRNQRQLHYLLTNFVPAPKMIPGNHGAGSPSSSMLFFRTATQTPRPQGCISLQQRLLSGAGAPNSPNSHV